MKQWYICVLTLAGFGLAPAYSQIITLNSFPSRAVGTPQLTVKNGSQSPNLVEGREFYWPEAVALDNSVSPPHIYVSDYLNNRVLAWETPATFLGGKPANFAIGQPDLVTTFSEGPGAQAAAGSVPISLPQTGLTLPSGLAVDSSGNLYVADGGNNRVLRYPKPFAQLAPYPVPDLWIGQSSANGYGSNSPSGSPNSQGLSLVSGNTVLQSSLTFDSSGNLWMLDTGNRRVLEFNASNLGSHSSLAGNGGGLTADVVLGQADFVSNGAATNFYDLTHFVTPTSLAFDPAGNLFVGDTKPSCTSLPCGRVLVFQGPTLSIGMSASPHILGIFSTSYTYPTGAALQTLIDQTNVASPSGLFFMSSGSVWSVGVVDSLFHRIMIFPPFASWPTDGTPPVSTITPVGQPNTCSATSNGNCKAANGGNPQPSNATFSSPSDVACTKAQPSDMACTGGDLYIADLGNNRVLDLPIQGATISPASGVAGQWVAGQPNFKTNSPNLIEGREFQFAVPGTSLSDAGMAIDNSTGTPHLYVADPYNNRILGFKDLRTFCFPTTPGCNGNNAADIVLGQADVTTALINYPTNDPNKPSSSSLYRPIGLAVDAAGNLYVADSFNGRVLRFPCPFSYAGLETNSSCTSKGPAPEPADLVLGQQTFTTTPNRQPTLSQMSVPYGLAFTPSCDTPSQVCSAPQGLVVSDQALNRVLYIPTTTGTFTANTDNFKAATVIFGQPDGTSGSTLTALANPHHVSCDTNGNVYVADTGNSRVMVFPNPASATTGQHGQAIQGLSAPEGVYVSPHTGEIWVANTGARAYVRYASETNAVLGQAVGQPIVDVSGKFAFRPLAVLQDQYGDLLGADDAHRVALYFPGIVVTNAASNVVSTVSPLAPNAIGTIWSVFTCNPCSPSQFLAPVTSGTYPLPKILADTQVLVNNVPAPLYFVSGGQINFVVPSATPSTVSSEVDVVQVSTGRVLGTTSLAMSPYAPAAFVGPGGQTATTFYAAAINQDGTVNGPGNPAIRGQYVTLYMTGEGFVSGAPPDGVPATSPISTPLLPTILFGPNPLPASSILYSGLDQFPGMWQISFTIPTNIVPVNGALPFAVFAPDLTPNWASYTTGYATYIFVK